MGLKPLENKKDLEVLMTNFYTKAIRDDIIGEKFKDLDLLHHIPIIVNFWESTLFYTGDYKGNPFQKHLHLNLEPKHFKRWLELFTTEVDSLFNGNKAEEIKQKARSIAYIFQSKIAHLGKTN